MEEAGERLWIVILEGWNAVLEGCPNQEQGLPGRLWNMRALTFGKLHKSIGGSPVIY